MFYIRNFRIVSQEYSEGGLQIYPSGVIIKNLLGLFDGDNCPTPSARTETAITPTGT